MAIDIDEAKVERNELGLWLGWTLATALGMMLGYLPSALVVDNVDLGIALVVVPILTGLLIGLAQWLVLRGYVIHSQDWILNLAGGWVAGYALALFVVQLLGFSPLGALVSFFLFGVIVAVFQWPVLRREIPNILPWIVANVIGWTLGSYAGQAAGAALVRAGNPGLIVNTLAIAGVTGLVAGAVTGLALVWIVRRPERAYA